MTIVNYDWDEDEDNIVEEYDDTGTTVAEYTTEPELFGNVISQSRNGQDRVYHYDGQGSTLALSDANGDVTDTYAYSAFGTRSEHTGSTSNPFQYIGQKGYYRDEETGVIEVRLRTLEPKYGRWATTDPMLFRDSLNRYLYVLSNVVNSIDPSGALKCSAECIAPAKQGVFHAGPRGGIAEAVIFNTEHDKPTGFRTVMVALFAFDKNGSWKEKWHAHMTPIPDPTSFNECCCCCTSVNWTNVFVRQATGSKKALNFLSEGPPNGVPYIDKNLPYAHTTPFNPCTNHAPTQTEKEWWSFRDGPGMNPIKQFFDMGGTSFAQKFSTCVYCEKGPEAYNATIPFMVTYCCFDWGHEVSKRNGKLYISRWLGEWGITWPFDGDNLPGKTGIHSHKRGPVKCGGPTSSFIDAVKSARYWPEKK